MINDENWSNLKQMILEVLSWASHTMMFDLTVNDVSIKLSILDFAFGVVAFDLIVGLIWAVLAGRSSND